MLEKGFRVSGSRFNIEDWVININPATGYQKTTLSDLQGAWEEFRQSVVDSGGFDNMDRILLHTDEAMSWETVRNLNRMPALILIIRNLCLQNAVSDEIMLNLGEVTDMLDETLAEFPN